MHIGWTVAALGVFGGVAAGCGGTSIGNLSDGGTSDSAPSDGATNHEGGGNGASCLGNAGACQAVGTTCAGANGGQATCASGYFCCEDEGTPHDGGAPPDSGGVGCPASPPSGADTACPKVGLECEYGSNANLACNQLYTCQSSGWLTGEVACPEPTCPASYSAVPTGHKCDTDGGICGYPQGTCTCSSGSPPLINGPEWQCFPAQAGCPSPRPDIGTGCTASPSLVCNYGACSGGISLSCTDGTWQDAETACPG
jgi:hypothetical protein